ncbi:hypothetical protein [Dactylosporangium sp. CA-139066]|uniref:hypothetical protein n=1 Tax=Dactylosporangium sp. CA-139066 TaxID=3239930 RepID=UPI003D8E2017
MKLRRFALVVIALVGLAGCDGSGGGAPAATTGGPQSQRQALAAAAQCMRDNGHPDWPDPVQNGNGDWVFPDSAPDVPPAPACAALFRTAKGGGAGPSRRPLSAAEIAQARTWSACIREHGVPGWPDPDADGTIDPPAALLPLESNEAYLRALPECRSVEPPNGPRLPPRSAGPGDATKPPQ